MDNILLIGGKQIAVDDILSIHFEGDEATLMVKFQEDIRVPIGTPAYEQLQRITKDAPRWSADELYQFWQLKQAYEDK